MHLAHLLVSGPGSLGDGSLAIPGAKQTTPETRFHLTLWSGRCDVFNADEIEKFQAFSYRCAWVVIEGEAATGYVIT